MEVEKINSKMISVVIQGLIVGNDEKEYNKQFTKRCIDSVRKYLPEAQIILSTWERCDVSDLNYDVLVKGDEPKDIYMLSDSGSLKLMTVNNQIISTQNGLRMVDRKYTLKIRSDMLISGLGFIKYFIKYNKNIDSDILIKKVVTLPTYNPRKTVNFLFDPCDWLFFGLTDDIKNIFEIPLMREESLKGENVDDHFLVRNNLEAEQYIWTNFLSKYKKISLPSLNYFSRELMCLSEESYAKNLIMVPANKANVQCLKMPRAGYGARPWLSQGLYTFSDYKRMYNTYNDKKIFYIPNFIESILYFIAYNSRLSIKKYTPNIYKKVVNFIRKINGSYNFLK